jgi:RNA polymerase primary sigma factor
MSCTTFDRKSRAVHSNPNLRTPRLHDAPLLTVEEECELARAVAKGDLKARDRLVQSNLRLVIVIARGYLRRGLVLEDLIGEGNLGLFRAAKEFDPSFGCRFSTYASYWIKQAIRHALINTTATIRLPAHMVTMLSKLGKNGRELSRSQGQAATFDQVASRMGLTDMRRDLASSALRSRRLTSNQEGDGSELANRASDMDERPEADVERSDDARCLGDRMDERLDARERDILRQRFGLDGREPLTLQEVGRKIGVTREWVRKIELRAIEKLGEGANPFGL